MGVTGQSIILAIPARRSHTRKRLMSNLLNCTKKSRLREAIFREFLCRKAHKQIFIISKENPQRGARSRSASSISSTAHLFCMRSIRAGGLEVSNQHSEETYARGSANRKRRDVGQLQQHRLPEGSVLSLCLPRPKHQWTSRPRGPLGRWAIPMAARRLWEWTLAYQTIQVNRVRTAV
jgi:hypothetical protein